MRRSTLVLLAASLLASVASDRATATAAINIGLIPLRDAVCAPAAPGGSPPAATPAGPVTTTVVPVASPAAAAPILPFGTPVLAEADYPQGEDAAPDVAEAIAALETRYAACLNAGDLPAAAALLDAPLRARLFPPALLARKAEASPVPAADPVGAIALRCLRQAPDGAAIALVDRFDDNAVRAATMMRVYRQTPDGWRVVEQAGVRGVTAAACP